MTKSVAIIGASRGIGLGFARAYAGEGWNTHVTTRAIGKPGELGKIKGNITIHNLDVCNSQQIAALAEEITDIGIDVLIHNAGVNDTGMQVEEVMKTNAEAPFDVISALLPAIARGSMKKVAILTSQMGARNGGATPSSTYGKSKCALNDRFREIEMNWRELGISSIVFHPGWVATDMGGRFAPVSVEESVNGMRNVIETLTSADSGSFFNWKGNKHPW